MPKPVLQAMVLAEHVYQDRNTGKFVIAGTFGTIFRGAMTKVPDDGKSEIQGEIQVVTGTVSQMGSPYLYLALAEVHGDVPLQLKFIDLSDASVLLEAHFGVVSADPVAVAEYTLPMPMLPVPRLGMYSLDLLYEGEILGSWRIAVRPAKPIEPEGEQ